MRSAGHMRPAAVMVLMTSATALAPGGVLAVSAQPPPAQPWVDQCAIGNVDLCAEQVAEAFAGRGPAFHRLGAVKLFTIDCEADEPESCMTLGLLYVTGFGVEVDLPRAAFLLDQACLDQVPWACVHSARLSVSGEGGVPRNLAKAATLNGWACEANLGSGCTELGFAYALGRGVKEDRARARALYAKGCALGDKWGCRR